MMRARFTALAASSLLVLAVGLSSCTRSGKVEILNRPSSGLVQGMNDDHYHLLNTADSKLRLGDRLYVKTTLDDIFGPGVSEITQRLIMTKTAQFGGPCDPAISDTECSSPVEAFAALVPIAITARESYRTRACEEISSQDSAILHAYMQAKMPQADSSSGVVPGWPGIADFQLAYDLFYPGRAMPSGVASALLEVTEAAKRLERTSPVEGWRYLLLTLCLAPDWQLP